MDLVSGAERREEPGRMKIGDYVIYIPDGSRGTVVEMAGGLYHVVWEDHFSSWERGESLRAQDADAAGG